MKNLRKSIKDGFADGWDFYKADYSLWEELSKDIATRLKKPLNYPAYILYFTFITALTGATGVFTTIYFELQKCQVDHWNVSFSMGTYFIALIASASADLILGDSTEKKEIKALGLCLILAGMSVFWLVSIVKGPLSYLFASIGVVIALVTWWIANAYNSNLTNGLNPDNATPILPTVVSGDAGAFNLEGE
jgi:hypothetical protein